MTMSTSETSPASSRNQSFFAQTLSMASSSVRSKLARWERQVPLVTAFEDEIKTLRDDELRKRSLSLRYRARSGERLTQLMPEAFALVREAARRTVEMRHFDVQILGGIALFDGCVTEMETGEGKTLAAILPMYFVSLAESIWFTSSMAWIPNSSLAICGISRLSF